MYLLQRLMSWGGIIGHLIIFMLQRFGVRMETLRVQQDLGQ